MRNFRPESRGAVAGDSSTRYCSLHLSATNGKPQPFDCADCLGVCFETAPLISARLGVH